MAPAQHRSERPPSAPTVWFGGGIAAAEPARVPVTDRGLLLGEGVFETCLVTAGGVFAWRRHRERLARSAAIVDLPLPDARVVERAVEETLAAAPEAALVRGRLRVTVTAGSEGRSEPRLLVTLVEASPPSPAPVLVTVPWRRNELAASAGAKTTSYVDNRVAARHAGRAGGDEALFLNCRGHLCEGATSNVFLLSGSRLRTPALSSGCLPGVTRDLLLLWAREDGWDVAETELDPEEVATAEAVLITGSVRGVQAASRVDAHVKTPSPAAQALVDLFARRQGEDLDP